MLDVRFGIVLSLIAMIIAAPGAPAQDLPADQPRRVLLREGVEIIEARGTVVRVARRNAWVFRIEQGVPNVGGFELTILPCGRLAEILPAVDETNMRHPVFEMTGRVYLHEDDNYILPTSAPQVVDFTPPPPPSALTDDPTTNDAPAGSIAESIARDLERAVGPLAHSSDLGGQSAESGVLLKDGTMMLTRRGRITRNGGGAYIFVRDADSEGLADPPLVLLPCRLLEQIERHVRQGRTDAVILSGRVHAFQGVNYLLPTVFRVARERTPLRP